MSYRVNCGCEHGMNCTRVRACAVDDMIDEAVREVESKAEDEIVALRAQLAEAQAENALLRKFATAYRRWAIAQDGTAKAADAFANMVDAYQCITAAQAGE